jgi:hypothetical protein
LQARVATPLSASLDPISAIFAGGLTKTWCQLAETNLLLGVASEKESTDDWHNVGLTTLIGRWLRLYTLFFFFF